ncbi:hypothetical protein [Abyssicoccus albus]|uniref:hypothetical protein n=1 Tax=Abyssicoccus albus TaxID=1817405 RepID=UPI00097E3D1E|nr:hypothetical protein [Abyssicoccus albus]AQL56430.1 hypothetical protein BVH56_05600 [Abyssicoccus albus]
MALGMKPGRKKTQSNKNSAAKINHVSGKFIGKYNSEIRKEKQMKNTGTMTDAKRNEEALKMDLNIEKNKHKDTKQKLKERTEEFNAVTKQNTVYRENIHTLEAENKQQSERITQLENQVKDLKQKNNNYANSYEELNNEREDVIKENVMLQNKVHRLEKELNGKVSFDQLNSQSEDINVLITKNEALEERNRDLESQLEDKQKIIQDQDEMHNTVNKLYQNESEKKSILTAFINDVLKHV